jgi:hypothetical protein
MMKIEMIVDSDDDAVDDDVKVDDYRDVDFNVNMMIMMLL